MKLGLYARDTNGDGQLTERLNHELYSEGPRATAKVNVVLNGDRDWLNTIQFTQNDVIYCYGDPEILVGLQIEGSAVKNIEIANAKVSLMLGSTYNQLTNVEGLRLTGARSLQNVSIENAK